MPKPRNIEPPCLFPLQHEYERSLHHAQDKAIQLLNQLEALMQMEVRPHLIHPKAAELLKPKIDALKKALFGGTP
jgi:hypothetical protein